MSNKIKIALLTILTLLIINCGNVFAISETQFNNLVNRFPNFPISQNNKEKILNYSNTYEYTIITSQNGFIDFYFFNQYTYKSKLTFSIDNAKIFSNSTEMWSDYGINFGFNRTGYWYLSKDLYNNNGEVEVHAGENYEVMGKDYTKPYFEFATNKIGKTTINNNKIDTFYKKDFELWTNQYSTNKLIGYLYIDKNYILDDIFMPVLNINQSNLSQTQSWSYKRISIF